MTGLAGGGYPTGYRTADARVLSRTAPATKDYEIIPPKPKTRPGISGWNDIVGTGSPLDITNGPKGTVKMTLPGFDANRMSDQLASDGWSWRDRQTFRGKFGFTGNTIELSPDEYRRVTDAVKAKDWKTFVRVGWRLFRGFTRNKDIRLELVSRLFDILVDRLDDTLGLQSETETFPSGWTVTGMCPTAKPTFDSKAVWRNVENPCLPLQAAIGRDGTGPFLDTRGLGHWSTAQFRWLYGKWESVSNGSRASHWRSAWTPWQYWLQNPIGSINRETIGKLYPQFAFPGRALIPSAHVHPRPGSSAQPGRRPPVKDVYTTHPDPLPDLPVKMRDKKFAIAFNSRAAYGRFVNGVTEMVDVVDIAYKSLGKKCGAKTPQGKLACIHANWNTMNWDKFILGLVENQIEDYAWGRLGQVSAKAARRANRSTGFQMGPWDTEGSYHANGISMQIRNNGT